MIEAKPMITIRHALLDDLYAIMQYIEKEWKPGHILAKDEAFFRYQYCFGEAVNFIIATDPQGVMVGMLGYIRASASEDCDVWTTMWKVSKNSTNPVLGIELLEFLRGRGHRSVMSLGINAKTIGIYKYLGFKTGSMSQFYMPNRSLQRFEIAVMLEQTMGAVREPVVDGSYSLREIDSEELSARFDFERQSYSIPKKDAWYFSNRYFEHPIYRYEIHGVFHGNDLVAVLVMRAVSVQGATALRIVDILGDVQALRFIGRELQALVTSRALEYIDLVCFGVPPEALKVAGFLELNVDCDATVIPNYFAPFVQKNVKINFFSDSLKIDHFRFFKADGDQDRPN